MLAGELGEPPEGRSAGLGVVGERRHRHQPAQQRVALAVALDLALGNAALRLLAGEVDLEQPGHGEPAGGRVGVDRMHELADLVHDARLVRLQGADEVPAEGIAVQRVLALHVLRPVLTRDRDAGVGEDAHVLRGDVLRRGDDGDARPCLGADGVVRGADRVGVHASSRAARSRSQSRVLWSGSSTTSTRSSCRTRPRSGPSREPDRAEVVTRDGEVGQMVRL